MDNFDNNIDEVFKSRFTDAKDYSLNSDAGWKAVEVALNSKYAMASSAAASTGKFAIFKVAAVFTSSITIAGLISSDTSLESKISKFNDGFSLIYDQTSTQNAQDANIASFQLVDEQLSLPPSSADGETNHLESSIQSTQNLVTLGDSLESIAAAHDQKQSPENESHTSLVETLDGRAYDGISKMLIGVIKGSSPSDIDNLEIIEPEIDIWNSNHMWFLRGGMRIGSGESNSFEIDSEWKANPSFSFGYGYAISDNSYITAEVGWIRRSGNGIERTRDVDLNPIISGIAASYGGNLSEQQFIIHESLVATRMDYVHIPINYNHQFADKWTFTAGGFVDFLIAAKNDAYIVYNNTEYQASVTGKSELNTLNGLNKIRYGASLGVERSILGNLSSFGQMMVPLNTAVDSKSEYRVIDETNKLIDLQFGFTYRI